jgi:TP901 family phage tail tape measure protein
VADSTYEVDFNANDNISSVLSKISRNLETLTNNFSDLAGAIKDISGGIKTATSSSSDSLDKLAKSSDKAAEAVTKNFSSILRSSQTTLLKLQPGINKTVEALDKLIQPSLGKDLTSGQSNLADFSGLRSGATDAIARISQLRDQIQALYPEARKGSESAAESVKSLTQQYREAAAGLKRYQEQLQSGSTEFSQIQGPKNAMLSSMGLKPITLNDIFPTAEQQKFEDVQRRIQQATFKSIQQGAVRETLNSFVSTNFALDQVDENILRISTHLPRMRYALYDVANTAAATGAALLAIPVASIAIAASFERDFANVERTVDKAGTGVGSLKQDLIELSQTIPVSFKELTEIGTLAGQLDIAKENVAAFTETVAQFSATTDVTINEAATAFGRLSNLIDGVDGQFSRLGSSILKVGVNSVATESQIIRIAQQISSIGNLAGFSADQIIGLSGSLASVGTTPELSRGLVTRLFTEINGAISGANNNLEEFAKLSGQTGAEFKKTWEEGGGAYQLVAFLRGLDSQGAAAEQTLRSLNIASVRDIPTVLKLAQGYEKLLASLEDAQSGFRENTELQRQYNVITSTLSEKINVLGNNLQALAATAGNATGPIGFLVDGLIKFIQAVTVIVNNPINGFLITTALAITGLIGVAGLLSGALSRVSGGFAGLVEAQIRVREAISNARVAYAENALAARAAAAAQAQVATTGTAMSGVLSQTLVDTRANAAGMAGFARSIREVVFASAAFKAVMSTILISSGIGIGLIAISAAWEGISNATKSATDRARDYYGDTSSIIKAAQTDTEELSEGLQSQADIWKTVNIAAESDGLKNTAESAARAVGPVKDLGLENEALKSSLNLTTEALRSQELAFGKNAEAAALKLVQDKILADADNPLAKLFADEFYVETLKKANFNLQQFTKDAIAGNEEAVKKSISDLQAYLDSQATLTYNPNPGFKGENWFKEYQILNFLEDFSGKTLGVVTSQVSAIRAINATSDSVDAQGNAIVETTDSLEEYEKAFNEAFGDVDAVNEFYSSLETLRSGIEANGTAFDLLSSSGSQNLANLRGALVASVSAAETMGMTAAQGIAYVFAQLAAQGVDTAALLAKVAGMSINGVTINAQEVATAMGQIPADTFKNIGKSAGGAAKEVRTLSDYANDLASVFSRAFEIRFSSQSTLDDITSSFQDIADSTEDAKQKISDLRADLDSLTADKALQEYFLSVALAYGDTLAAAQIQAKLNKINNQITNTNEDLSDAQNDVNKTLVGNSAAAIANRKTITSLVQTYQSHIQALAASGMSQEELAAQTAALKQQFLDQAAQLGFNRNELGTYALAFDDVSTAIANVPRNITVTANTNPALQALNEFVAKAKSSLGSGLTATVQVQTREAAARMATLAAIAYATSQSLAAGSNTGLASAWSIRASYLQSLLRQGNWGALAGFGITYATGGYVSGPGGPTSDSINARLSNGEYVMNAAAVNRYGVGFMDQLNQMRAPRFAAGGMVSAPQGGGMVSLSPEDRALLRNVGGSGQVVLYANNEAIARSANDGNRSIVAAGGRP